jgi:hypothetical protein
VGACRETLGCTPHHVKLMDHVFKHSPVIFEAVRTNSLTHSKEVRAIINSDELRTEKDRQTVLDLYRQNHRRGRNPLLDICHAVVREAKVRKLPRRGGRTESDIRLEPLPRARAGFVSRATAPAAPHRTRPTRLRWLFAPARSRRSLGPSSRL